MHNKGRMENNLGGLQRLNSSWFNICQISCTISEELVGLVFKRPQSTSSLNKRWRRTDSSGGELQHGGVVVGGVQRRRVLRHEAGIKRWNCRRPCACCDVQHVRLSTKTHIQRPVLIISHHNVHYPASEWQAVSSSSNTASIYVCSADIMTASVIRWQLLLVILTSPWAEFHFWVWGH